MYDWNKKNRRLLVDLVSKELPPGFGFVFVPAEDETVDPEMQVRDHLGTDTGLAVQLCADGSYSVGFCDGEGDDFGLTTIVDTPDTWRASIECVAKAHEIAKSRKAAS